MDILKIPKDALVFVGDGRKALVLRNVGNAVAPDLKAEIVFEDDNPPSREQGSDRPGRVADAVLGGRRSALGEPDWHELEEHRFVQQVAETLERLVRDSGTKALIVVAPPRTLADLRRAFHPDVKARVTAEINKDLTRLPVADIQKHLLGSD